MTASMHLLRMSCVQQGEELTVHVHDGPGNSLDWLVIRKAGAGNDDWLGWAYLNNSQTPPATDDGREAAHVNLTAPDAPGEYVISFHSDDTYSVLASMPFTVV